MIEEAGLPVIVAETVAAGLIVKVLVLLPPVNVFIVIGNVSDVEYVVSVKLNTVGPQTP